MSTAVRREIKPEEDRKHKVTRYRAGKAPQWSAEQSEDVDAPVAEVVVSNTSNIRIEQKYDPRLARLQKTHVDKEEALSRRRERHEDVAEIVSTGANYEPRIPVRIKEEDMDIDEVEEEDEEEAERRRERARMLYKQKEEEGMDEVAEEGEEEEEDEYESEYEDSDYDEFSSRPAIQPVFVSKTERATIEERDRLIAEEEALEKEKQNQIEQRKVESAKILKEQLERDRLAALQAAQEGELERIDSDEESEDEAKEYELWKQREISRIKRDREEREAFFREREETAKRREMSDLEIRQIDKEKFVKVKKKWNFMQKYYHTGAFFREWDKSDIQAKVDFSQPVGEDHVNKEALPKVMQVKHFGRSGRTKYTHLLDQDTTKFDAGWMATDPTKFNQKLGGLHGDLDRPSKKKA